MMMHNVLSDYNIVNKQEKKNKNEVQLEQDGAASLSETQYGGVSTLRKSKVNVAAGQLSGNQIISNARLMTMQLLRQSRDTNHGHNNNANVAGGRADDMNQIGEKNHEKEINVEKG